MNLKCTRCDSENTQRLELAYKSGVSSLSGSSTNIGVGVGIGGVGAGVSEGQFSGTQQTLLSESIEPPKQKISGFGPTAWLMLFVTVTFLLGGDMKFFMVLFLINMLFFYLSSSHDKKSKKIYNKQIEEYRKKFICLRCGNVFEPLN